MTGAQPRGDAAGDVVEDLDELVRHLRIELDRLAPVVEAALLVAKARSAMRSGGILTGVATLIQVAELLEQRLGTYVARGVTTRANVAPLKAVCP